MAEVIHRYVGDPEAKRGKSAAWRGMASLRKEKTEHERAKRQRLEMQVALERGALVRKDLVLQQAGFLLVAMRQRCMSAPSAWARRLVGINDARVMTEKLKDMMTAVLEDLADLPQRVTAGELSDDAPSGPAGPDGGNGDD